MEGEIEGLEIEMLTFICTANSSSDKTMDLFYLWDFEGTPTFLSENIGELPLDLNTSFL